MNKYVIGDVHGCYNTLLNLINKLPKNADLIFVGDLCDRGKYSKEVIEFVLSHNYLCIKGNHEKYMVNHLQDVLFNNKKNINWLKASWGGEATIRSYENTDLKTIERHLWWIKKLPSYILLEDKYFITHGFALPYFKRRESSDENVRHAIMSNRIFDDKYKSDWEDFSDYKEINIFGHCRFEEVLIGKNYYGIDTGCSYGNNLTAIELGSMNIIDEPFDNADVFDEKYN